MYDYAEGAHPQILEALVKSNYEQQLGYGEDKYSFEAVGLIRQLLQSERCRRSFCCWWYPGKPHCIIICIASL